MTEQLRKGQRVQLNLEAMKPFRREVYAGQGPGVVTDLGMGERVWVLFDNGWNAMFWTDEVQAAVEQIGLFAQEPQP